eukprot:1379515-Rhodomonas_salina.5
MAPRRRARLAFRTLPEKPVAPSAYQTSPLSLPVPIKSASIESGQDLRDALSERTVSQVCRGAGRSTQNKQNGGCIDIAASHVWFAIPQPLDR